MDFMQTFEAYTFQAWFKNSWLKSPGLKGPGLKLEVEKVRDCTLYIKSTYLDEVSVTFCPDEAGLDPEL